MLSGGNVANLVLSQRTISINMWRELTLAFPWFVFTLFILRGLVMQVFRQPDGDHVRP